MIWFVLSIAIYVLWATIMIAKWEVEQKTSPSNMDTQMNKLLVGLGMAIAAVLVIENGWWFIIWILLGLAGFAYFVTVVFRYAMDYFTERNKKV